MKDHCLAVRLFLLFVLFPLELCGMQVSTLDRSANMYQWEKSELMSLVHTYEGTCDVSRLGGRLLGQVNGYATDQLIENFITLCCSTPYKDLDLRLYAPLQEMISNPIGRELVYRTMAKIGPRIRCLESVRNFLERLTGIPEEDILAIYFLVSTIGVPSFCTINELIASFLEEGLSFKRLRGLYNDPVEIRRDVVCSETLNISVDYNPRLVKYRDLMMQRIEACVYDLEQNICKLRFNLRYDDQVDDSFDPSCSYNVFW